MALTTRAGCFSLAVEPPRGPAAPGGLAAFSTESSASSGAAWLPVGVAPTKAHAQGLSFLSDLPHSTPKAPV